MYDKTVTTLCPTALFKAIKETPQNAIKINSLKLVSAIFYEFFIFSRNDSPLKTMKNVFYFV